MARDCLWLTIMPLKVREQKFFQVSCIWRTEGCQPNQAPVLFQEEAFCGRSNLRDCRVQSKWRHRLPSSLCSGALFPCNAGTQHSNDCFGFPTPLVLRWCLGWRIWDLCKLKRHLFCKLITCHHSAIHTSLWWVGFVVRHGQGTGKILDVHRWELGHMAKLSTPRAKALGGSAGQPRSWICSPTPVAPSSLPLRAGLCELT